MTEAPRDIRRFESVQLVLMFLGLISSFIINHRPLIDTFAIGVLIGLTFLVTRGRMNWARWVLLTMYVLGILIQIWTFRAILAFGHPIVVLASAVLRGAALTLAFTPQSNEWLRASPQQA
jgi:hypothetical protein